MTHTYALLEISQQAYDEIATKLRDASYDHMFGDDGEIDMRGVALIVAKTPDLDPMDAWNHAMGIIP